MLANAPALREALKAAGISTLAELDASPETAAVPSLIAAQEAEKAAAKEASEAAAAKKAGKEKNKEADSAEVEKSKDVKTEL